MIVKRVNSLRDGLCTSGLMVVLVLGIMAAHVPLPVLACMPAADCDSSESCKACENNPNKTIARQVSSGKPAVAAPLENSDPETPDDEPCCRDRCNHCSLPCCGDVLVANAPSTTSTDVPAAASIVPIASGTFSTIELADVFHPPRV